MITREEIVARSKALRAMLYRAERHLAAAEEPGCTDNISAARRYFGDAINQSAQIHAACFAIEREMARG